MWIELEYKSKYEDDLTFKIAAFRDDVIEQVNPVADLNRCVFWNSRDSQWYEVKKSYSDMLSLLNGSTRGLDESIGSQIRENARLLEENETLRRVVQNLQEVNGELRADAAKEFTAGTQYSDPHVRMALGAAIEALKEIAEGDLDTQYKCAVEATKCLHVIEDTLKAGETLKKETQSKPE